MIALDIEAFMDRGEFDERLEHLVEDVLSAPPIDPDRPIQLPGQAEQERAAQRISRGIPVDQTTFDKLRELASDIGAPFLLEPIGGD